jgi:hypothetical protein
MKTIAKKTVEGIQYRVVVDECQALIQFKRSNRKTWKDYSVFNPDALAYGTPAGIRAVKRTLKGL